MGMRANFEEDYTGDTLQGSYIGGVYYPDKTRVGWWKNGYPEYFAKVLNAPSWIGLHIKINGELLDLNTCLEVKNFRRQLNMKEGWYERSFTAMLPNQQEIQVKVLRFLSLRYDELGALRYEITPLTTDAAIEIESYLDKWYRKIVMPIGMNVFGILWKFLQKITLQRYLPKLKKQGLKCILLCKINFL